jgi:hypothetical protein
LRLIAGRLNPSSHTEGVDLSKIDGAKAYDRNGIIEKHGKVAASGLYQEIFIPKKLQETDDDNRW